MKNFKVIIPLKTNSERILNKNLKPFFKNKSLFDIKAEQLLEVITPHNIFVSSENPDVEKIATKYGFNFLLRDISLTYQSALETDIVKNIVNQVTDNEDIMWVQVTQPLFNEFSKVIQKWKQIYDDYDSLAVVKKINHHIIDNNGNAINYNFGYWHKISQFLIPYYEVTWSCFFMKMSMLKNAWYYIGRNPYLYITETTLVDINNQKDFEVASILYENYYK